MTIEIEQSILDEFLTYTNDIQTALMQIINESEGVKVGISHDIIISNVDNLQHVDIQSVNSISDSDLNATTSNENSTSILIAIEATQFVLSLLSDHVQSTHNTAQVIISKI